MMEGSEKQGSVREDTNGNSSGSYMLTSYHKSTCCWSKEKEDLILQLVALLFVRLFIDGKQFLIGCNIQEGGIFGDILLKLFDSHRNRILMLHVNYMSKYDINAKNKKLMNLFDLLTYIKFVSLLKEDFVSNKNLNYLGKFDDFEFVIYSNVRIDDCLSLSCSVQTPDEINSGPYQSIFCIIYDCISSISNEIMLYKLCLEKLNFDRNIDDQISVFESQVNYEEIICKLNFFKENPSEDILKSLYNEVKDIKTSSFSILSKLKFYCQQADNVSMPEQIKIELSKLDNISSLGIQILYKFLIKKLKTWFLCDNYLTKECLFYNEFYAMLQKCIGIPKTELEIMSTFGIKFFIFPTKDMEKCIEKYKVLNIIACSTDISLTCIKVHQVLETLSSSFLWLSAETFILWKDYIVNLWLSECFPFLVIEYNYQVDDATLNDLFHCCSMHASAKLVVISSDHLKFISNAKRLFAGDFYEMKDHFRFVDLDDQTQSKILKKEVVFQGKVVPMGSLLGTYSELKGVLTACVLCKLFKSDTFYIGPSINEMNHDFIPRFLELCVEVDINILKVPHCKEIFAVSGISELELRTIIPNEDIATCAFNNSVNCRIFCIPLNEAENIFSTLCNHFPLKNVHRLIFKNGNLLWKESRGQTQYLKDHVVIDDNARHIWKVLDQSKQSKYIPKTLLDTIEHHTIVIAESGMGKSTLINYLQNKTKKEAPLNWLIHLNFNGDISLLAKTRKEDYDCEIIIQILYSLLNSEYHASEIEHILLRHDLEKRGNVIIICDGFESVSYKNLGKVLDFINALNTMNIKKLWITSTPNMKSFLERHFNVVVYELQSLTAENQQNLLLNLWGKKVREKTLPELEDFAKTIQQVCQASKIDNIQVLAFPLICEIVAEIFQKDVSTYTSVRDVDWPENVDVIHLYDKFIKLKGLYNSGSNFDLDESHDLEEVFMNRHMLCALLSLLDVEELVELNLLDALDNVSKIVFQVKKFGIILGLVNKKPVFLHKTFSEYFAALWFSQNVEKSREFLKRRLFDVNFTYLSRFFDYFLIRGHELHTAVLIRDLQTVTSLIKYGVDVNALDKADRTALHLAIIHSKPNTSTNPSKSLECTSHDHIIKLLVDCPINSKTIDSLFFWRPIQYAIELKKWDAMDLLLKEQVSFCDIDCLKEKMNDKSFIHEGMLIGSEKGYLNLIEHFTLNGINLSEYYLETTVGIYSPLHVAARYGQLKLVRFFLSKKIKVSIKNNKGITPLHLAASEGMVEVSAYLLQRGADLNCADKNGNTPLDFAILRGNLQMVILLIEQYHSNINCQNKHGDTALHHAVEVGNPTIVEYILMESAHVNICNRDGNTPLHLATWLGNLSVIKLLLEYGADVNICNRNGDTPLSQNAGGGNLDIVKTLIESGANVNKSGDDGNTALHWAARQDQDDVLDYLLCKGADINAQNKYGNTALHRAVENGCLSTSKLLVNAGINIQLRNVAGYTAGNIRSRSKEVSECISCLV